LAVGSDREGIVVEELNPFNSSQPGHRFVGYAGELRKIMSGFLNRTSKILFHDRGYCGGGGFVLV